jgi:subtilisin-like proprotein convertase family protein
MNDMPKAFAAAALALCPIVQGDNFSNPGVITINDNAMAVPYPSTIVVPNLGAVTDVNVSIADLTHTFPDDVEILLVGPGGQTVHLFWVLGGTGALLIGA